MAEDRVALAGQIAQGLRDAGLAVDAVHGGPAALTKPASPPSTGPQSYRCGPPPAARWPPWAIGACANIYPAWGWCPPGARSRVPLLPAGGDRAGKGPGSPEGAWVAASPAPTAVTWLGPRLPA